MYGRRNPFVAREGLLILAAVFAAVIVLIRYFEPWTALVPSALFIFLYLIFRDPKREVPSVALGVVSPVDGIVVSIQTLGEGELGQSAHSIVIEINSLGTYTARSPVEGKIMDLQRSGLWVQTDEGDDIVMMFRGYRFGLAPHALARYGERLGLGQRCAYLRLTRLVEVQLPIDSIVSVAERQTVVAGVDLLGTVPNPR